MNSRGKLIAFCGIDGAGKTTQIDKLLQALDRQPDVITTKEPTDWFRSDSLVRAYLDLEVAATTEVLAELCLFAAADRLRHSREFLEPRLAAGHIVLCDRYVFCGYASLAAAGLTDLEWQVAINRHVLLPDITIYLDVEPEVACDRIMSRDRKFRKRQETDIPFLAKMRAAYKAQAWH